MAEPISLQDEPEEGAPTITTVARLANVSIASASRVLNGIRTSPETLARVTEAAEAVGYAPNETGQGGTKSRVTSMPSSFTAPKAPKRRRSRGGCGSFSRLELSTGGVGLGLQLGARGGIRAALLTTIVNECT